MAHAAQAKAHAHFAGKRTRCSAGDGKQAYLLDLAFVIQIVLMLGEVLRSAAGAQHDSDFALLTQTEFLRVDAGVFERFSGCGQGQRDSAGNMLALARFHPIKLVKVLDFSGNFDGKLGGVEPGYLLYAALAGKNSIAKR